MVDPTDPTAWLQEMQQMVPPTAMKLFMEAQAFSDLLEAETDRGCALMAAAYLDDKTRSVISRKLVECKEVDDLFSGTRPLATFSARIQFCLFLGLVPRKTFRDLNIIRSIRNEYAHDPKPLSFETERLKSKCLSLSSVVVGPSATARERFILTVLNIVGTLIAAEEQAVRIEECEERAPSSYPDSVRSMAERISAGKP